MRAVDPIVPNSQPYVLILMATYNGAEHLSEQLDSLIGQSHSNWGLLVSDDGSQDSTRDILARYSARGCQIEVINGPCRGAAENFMSLLRVANARLDGNTWLAFCDQDDVWLPSRLSNGLERLAHLGDHPAMVFSDLLVTDEKLRNPKSYACWSRPPAFRNALVQNIASGNATLLNPAAAKIASQAAFEAGTVVVHDWWVYQLITGAGGAAIYDRRPGLYYRQHRNNEIGSNHGISARLRRVAMVCRGRLGAWNEVNLAALERSTHRFTPENRKLLQVFSLLRDKKFSTRFSALREGRFYRQSQLGTAAVWIATALKRF